MGGCELITQESEDNLGGGVATSHQHFNTQASSSTPPKHTPAIIDKLSQKATGRRFGIPTRSKMDFSQNPLKRRQHLPVPLLPLKHPKYIADKHKTLAKNKDGNPQKSRTNQRPSATISDLSTTYPHTAGDSLFCYPFCCEYFNLLRKVSIVLMRIVHFASVRCCG